jgi:hypothetical protein
MIPLCKLPAQGRSGFEDGRRLYVEIPKFPSTEIFEYL